MSCPSCGFDNLVETKFCVQCGASLRIACPQCRFENPPGFAFCGRCGTLLAAPVPTAQAAALEGERRHLTMMFCDLVDSTPLSEFLDPEELREVIQAYQHTCAEVINRLEGHIAQYLGDGLLAYFGYPVAHEDDAQRAVRAGLGILAEWQRTNTQIQKTVPPLQERLVQVRIGIHTGLVVIGEMGGRQQRERMAVGETPNIASRLQSIATPDSLVISSTTYQLIQGFFECLDLGPQLLRGISTPLSVYRVLGESDVRSRFEVAVSRGLTPFVGREEEVGVLLERWEQVKKGRGQVVLVSGEGGIGKSRLVQELKERIAGEVHTRLECRCSPFYQNSAFYPVIDLLHRQVRLSGEDAPQEKLRKLESTLAHYDFSSQEVVPLFASLLSIPLSDRYSPPALTPQRQRQKTLDTLQAWVLKEAERQPVCFVWEDLQWADPSTLELLSLLIDRLDQAPTAQILSVLTFRPELSPPWPTHSHVTPITLSRLSRPQAEMMVEQMAGYTTLPDRVLQQVVATTDGVPLFVEEFTKMILESSLLQEQAGHYQLTGPLPLSAIPATLQDSLTARLDQLGASKEVAQLGATLGREFSYELIQAVSPLDEETLQRGLAQLVDAELIYQRGLPLQTRYIFKHALIQEAAYQSLLKRKRQQVHQQIAQVLEERFVEISDIHPELLAHHYTEAGLAEQAIPYWQRAGQKAVERSANAEAVGHLTEGLELLKTLPDTPAHLQQELMLQITLGVPLMVTKGYAASEVQDAYTRARELCQQIGETPQLFPVLFGLWAFYSVRGEHKTARELGEQLLRLAQSVQDSAFLLEARAALGNVLFLMGELVSARRHLEQGIAIYNPQQHHSSAFVYGQDPGVHCLSYATLVLWLLGYPDQALAKSRESLTLAREMGHPFSLAFALTFNVYLQRFQRQVQGMQERLEELYILSTNQDFSLPLAAATTHQGWALVELGQGEEGIEQIHQGTTAFGASGAELMRPYFLALLAEAHGRGGQTEEGLTMLVEALAVVDKTGERFYEAELYRLKGELLLALSREDQAEAEACFRQAINIARHQSAKSLELRAAMSLSRLLQKQGEKEEARQMLAEIYDWFTEGFDTGDLQEAKALLEEVL